MLTVSQRTEVVRHLGYPLIGAPTVMSAGPPYTSTFGQAGGLTGYRYFEFFPLLIYRLQNLSQQEEVEILGTGSAFFGSFYSAASASVTVTAPTPVAADAIVVQINGSPAKFTFGSSETATTIAAGLAAAINANPILASVVIAQAATNIVTISALAIGSRANALTIVAYALGASSSVAVTYAASPTVTLQGGQDPPCPVWTDTSEQVVQPYFGFLPIIRFWESQMTNAASGMDTVQAGPYKQRQDEFAARFGGYTVWCKRLAQFLGVPYMGAGNFMAASRTRVV